MTNIRHEKGDITTDYTGSKRIIREYYEKHRDDDFNCLDELRKFLKDKNYQS